MKTLPKVLIGTGVVAGVATFVVKLLTDDTHTFKDIPPDIAPPPPGTTGYKRVDALLPRLASIADTQNIPLGLLAGWIAKESGGKLATKPQPGPGDTSMDERGYGQLSPDESLKLRLDHQRLSTDSDYSLRALVNLIHEYEVDVQTLKLPAADGYSAFYWLLVKLNHTVGVGQTKKWAKAALDAGKADSWDDFKTFVLGKSWKGPQPKKWLPFMDELYAIGRPFGFGDTLSGPRVAGIPANEMQAHQRASGTWVVDGGGVPGRFPGGREPESIDNSISTSLVGLDIFCS